MINVNTDMIIPKQFLKTIKRTGLGQKGLFYEMRFDERRQTENEDFILDQAGLPQGRQDPCCRRELRLRIERANTPPGRCSTPAFAASSRRPFADIFYNNCFKNGILPIALPQEDVDKLMDDANRGANATVTVDLANQVITGPDGGSISFDLDPHRKHCLLEGLDDIGLTLQQADAISSYETAQAETRPWA